MSTQKPTFIPPFFKNFGKNAKDLFKKKYDFNHLVKTVNKSKNGVTIESGANVTSDFQGFVKAKYADKSLGEVEAEVNTDVKTESKLTVKATQLAKGVVATLGFSSLDGDKAFTKPTESLDVEYSQDNFAAQVVVKTDLETTKVTATGAVGFDGFAVGGQVVLDVSKNVDVVETNVGLEYSKNDLIASLFTEKNNELVNASYFQKVNKDTVVGAQFKYDLSGKQQRSLTVGTEYQLDFDTAVKAKADLPSGVVSTALEHRLANPRIQWGVSTQFNVRKAPLQAEKFGLQATFGDF